MMQIGIPITDITTNVTDWNRSVIFVVPEWLILYHKKSNSYGKGI